MVEFYGDKASIYLERFQMVANNEFGQVLSDYGSFPDVFNYNVIQDGGDRPPLIELIDVRGGIHTVKVQNNCWGESFDPCTD